MISKVLAVDFDGTLCKEEYPEIGKPNWEVIRAVKERQKDGWKIILCTMREGNDLKEALDACEFWGLHFDAVNDNLPEWQSAFKNNPRKIGATEYWDDRAVNPVKCKHLN